MPKFCAAVGCGNRSDRDGVKNFFFFPRAKDRCGRIIEEGLERRLLWLKALRREDMSIKTLQNGAYICEEHFLTGSPSDDPKHPDYIPNLKLGFGENSTRSFECIEKYRSYLKKKKLEANNKAPVIHCPGSNNSRVANVATQLVVKPQHVVKRSNLKQKKPKVKMVNKKCEVPYCNNNSTDTPLKIFITLPVEFTRRTKWFAAIEKGTNTKIEWYKSNRYYVCEDHFNLEQDCRNWMEYKMMSIKMFLKKDVVPHIFNVKKPSTKSIHKIEAKKTKTKEVKQIKSSTPAFLTKHKDLNAVFIVEPTITPQNNSLYTRVESIELLKKYSKFYLGLKDSSYKIISRLRDAINCSELDLLTTLVWTRHNALRRSALNLRFRNKSQIKSEIVLKIAPILAQFVTTNTELNIFTKFNDKCGEEAGRKVDLFEIQIAKSPNRDFNALTWSQYKSCNTIKYLISTDLKGCVNFVSKGFPGRVSDLVVIRDSASHSVNNLHLRGRDRSNIVVERVIRSVRKFNSIKKVSVKSIDDIYLLDNVVTIICALININSVVL